MPHRDDAIRYVENPATSAEELRRACELLLLPGDGVVRELRDRLRGHLDAHDEARPVICLNPGPVPKPAGRCGPRVSRPERDEYAAVFADEIALVPDSDDLAALLRSQVDTTIALAATFGEPHADLRYGPGKWTVRETIGHLSDCERVLSYRLLRGVRGDSVTLAGFDHVAYVAAGGFESRTLASLVSEFAAVRAATVALVQDTPSSAFAFRVPVGKGHISARALAYLIAGHERHHQALLRERYLPLVTQERSDHA